MEKGDREHRCNIGRVSERKTDDGLMKDELGGERPLL